MTADKAIKKIKKAFPDAIVKCDDNRRFSTIINDQLLTFFENGGVGERIVCIHTKRKDEEDDIYTDYFPGCFHDNITKALNYIGNK